MDKQKNLQTGLTQVSIKGSAQPVEDQYKHLSLRERRKLEMMNQKPIVEAQRNTKTKRIYEELSKKYRGKKKAPLQIGQHGSENQDQHQEQKSQSMVLGGFSTIEAYPEFMIRCGSTFKLYWDIIIITMALYNSIIIPIEIAWNVSELSSAAEIVVESAINMVFMIDIFLNFRITYISSISGDEIFDPKQIGLKYIVEQRFILDVLSSIPFNAFGTSEILPALGMLKLFRVTRISQVIRNLNIRSDTKAFLRVLWLIFFLFLYVHVIGCLWFYVANESQAWIPWKDTIFADEDQYQVYSSEFGEQYLVSFYTAYFLISSGEMMPTSNVEIMVAFIIMIISSMILANVFGQMTVLNADMNHKTIKFQQQLDTINTAMENLGLPKELKRDIKEYFINTFSRMDQQHELNAFLEDISPSLRLQISFQIFHAALETSSVFHSFLGHGHGDAHGGSGAHGHQEAPAGGQMDDHSIMSFVVKRLEVELATPEDVFVAQEDPPEVNNFMFFIAKGDCFVKVKDKLKDGVEEINHRSLLPGDHFGEIALLYGCQRTASVVANNYCTMAKMSKVHFDEMIHKYPKLVPKFKEKIYHYDDNVKLFLEKSLHSIEYLQKIYHEVKHEILYKLKKVQFEKGGSLIGVNDVATRMYIIQNGVVEIEHTVEGESFVIEKLTRGCILNHRSFLLADENDCNARCATTVTAYALEFEDFDAIRQNNDELDCEVMKVEQYLLNLPNQIALDYILKLSKDKRAPRDWKIEERRNRLTVLLKNAITQMWLKIKEQRRKPNLNEILKMVIKKKREDAKKAMSKNKNKWGQESKPKKEKKKKEKIDETTDPTQIKANSLYKDLVAINMKILDTGGEIDSIEKRVYQLQIDNQHDKEEKEREAQAKKAQPVKLLQNQFGQGLKGKLGLPQDK